MMTNTFSKMEGMPMRFEIKEDGVDCKTIKVSCDNAYDNVCKKELPIFIYNSSKVTLFQLLLAIQGRFEWFAAGDGNNDADNKKKLIFQHFGRALKGMFQCNWAKITKNNHNLPFETRHNVSCGRF